MYRIRVLDQLVYDSDANLTNVLITDDWKIWRIDFTRAFRLHKDLKSPGDLTQCQRALFDKLKAERETAVVKDASPSVSEAPPFVVRVPPILTSEPPRLP